MQMSKLGFHREMLGGGEKISHKRYIATVFTYLTVVVVLVAVFNINVEKGVDGHSVGFTVNEKIITHVVDALLIFIGSAIGITAISSTVTAIKAPKKEEESKKDES